MEQGYRVSGAGGEVPAASRNIVLKLIIFIAAVIFMGNLGAIVDAVLHPEIEYLDEEHLVVGGVTAVMTALLLGALALYAMRQEKLARSSIRAGHEAMESERKFREIFEESRDMLFVSTPEGFFEEINPAGVQLFGYNSREEMLHIKTSDLYASEEERESQRRQLEEAGFFKDHIEQMVRKDGSGIVASVTAEVVRDDTGKAVAYRGSIRDVTAQKRMEGQLAQAQKMESIGRLAGGVAHDFNNYLTTIQGYTELVMNSLPAEDPIRENLAEVQKAADSAAELTGQLLLFGRHQTMEMGPVDLNRNIKNLTPMIQRLIGDDVHLVNSLDGDLHKTVGDAGGLNQVIVNLVLNASQELSRGGEIIITTCSGHVSDEYLKQHPSARKGDFATISVSDNGPGMSSGEMEHIFEPFHQNGKKDIGLGLSVVYGIVLQHDGWIDVDSIPGMGTTYTIFLPAMASPVETAASHNGVEEDISGSGRILLVEDDDSVRQITEKMLRQSGYVVIGAHDAAEAFARFAGEKGDFQLVFSDVVLPGEDGISLVDNLKSHKPELAVLLASGYADTVVDWNRVQGRGYRFLQKPYVMPELLKTVRELMRNTS